MNNQQQPTQHSLPQNYNQGGYYRQQNSVVSVGDWMLTIFIMAIPFINIIMLFVWAFSGGPNKSKANWAKASLLWMLIIMIISFVIIGLIGGALLSNLFSEFEIF